MSTLSEVTNIPQAKLSELLYTVYLHNIYEGMNDRQGSVALDLGIGELQVTVSNAGPNTYKFIPTNEFDKRVDLLKYKCEDPLTEAAEEKINKIIVDFYKELL